MKALLIISLDFVFVQGTCTLTPKKISTCALVFRQTHYYRNSVLQDKVGRFNLFFRKFITTFLKWHRQYNKNMIYSQKCLDFGVSFKTIPFSYSFGNCALGCPMWGQAAQRGSPAAQIRSTLALVVNHFGSDMRFLGLISSMNIYLVLPMSWALCFFPLCLPGSWGEQLGLGVLCSPLEEGAMFDPWSTWRASWKLTQQQAAGPLSFRYWDGWDYFLSGRTLYFSYWTFPCKLKWENHALNRQAQVIIKNALYQAAWQYLH